MKSKILLVLLVLMSLLIAGCNEQEKYNTAKNEYQQMREECSRLELTTGEDQKLVNGKWTASTLAVNEDALTKHDELVQKMDAKIAEMEKYATAKVEINNDFALIKEEYRQHKVEWLSRVKQAKEKVENSKKKKTTTIDESDPWARYGRLSNNNK
ncbi:hypothetical protein [Selenomonas noxia]|uniref:hypothetical protein n=1 Tax=Selenomonas noxia TaxID=135083 RepID=UPI0028D2BE67|nr:hypothetical protein [Selenomonas noxia]